MAKTKLGEKRICSKCSAKFYDLEKDPIVCPACNKVFDPNATKLKRKAEKPQAKEEKPTEEKSEIDVDNVDEIDMDNVLEDTSDLDDDHPIEVPDVNDDD